MVEVLSQSANTAQNIDTLQMLWSRKYPAMQEQSFGYVGIKFDGYREELLLSVWMKKGDATAAREFACLMVNGQNFMPLHPDPSKKAELLPASTIQCNKRPG